MNFCTHCGTPANNPKTWPYTCPACHTLTYNSPKPVVALLLQGKDENNQPGFVLIHRGIEPYKDTWALPGGYIDYAEDWRAAAVREAKEEVGVTLDPQSLYIWGMNKGVVSATTNYLVLFVICIERVFTLNELLQHDITTATNDSGEQEILAIKIASIHDTSIELGVPTHNRFWKSQIQQV